MIFHGKGGYDFQTIYNLPIWLRKYTYNEMLEYYEEEQASIKNQKSAGKKTLVNSDGKINVPDFKQASKEYKGKSSYK